MFWNWTTAFEDIESLRREMDQLRERTQRYYTGSTSNYPLVNLYNQEDKVLVVAEVPGVSKQDLEISFLDGALKLSGERKAPELGDKLAQLREERGFGRFEKSIRIPLEVNADEIRAQLNDGVLQIELPKSERVKPRQIAIQ
ncbi:MAG: Hsp20/alpha crystallin family protein [Candidatus Sericytochromatia bacterium]